MRAAALPARPGQRGGDRVDEARVGVARHQGHAREAPRHEAAQEGRPAGAALAGHEIEAQGAHELVDAPRTDPGRVHVGDHRRQGLLRALARGQQPLGEVETLAQLGRRQLDRAGARVPAALTVTVATVDALRMTFTVSGAADGVDLGAHERLHDLFHHGAQEVDVTLLEQLA
jgi:hypothetical protein